MDTSIIKLSGVIGFNYEMWCSLFFNYNFDYCNKTNSLQCLYSAADLLILLVVLYGLRYTGVALTTAQY